MKTIVIAGGGSNVGKTTLARALGRLLPDARVAKLGTHPPRAGKPGLYFPIDTPFATVCEAAGACDHLIIESGAILDDSELVPELVIFLPALADRKDKPGSERRRARADLVRGEPVSAQKRSALKDRLDLDDAMFVSLLEWVGVP